MKYPKSSRSESSRPLSESFRSTNVKAIGTRKSDSSTQFSWAFSRSFWNPPSSRRRLESTKWCRTWSSPEIPVSVEATTRRWRNTGTQSGTSSPVSLKNTSPASTRRSKRNTPSSSRHFFKTLTNMCASPPLPPSRKGKTSSRRCPQDPKLMILSPWWSR